MSLNKIQKQMLDDKFLQEVDEISEQLAQSMIYDTETVTKIFVHAHNGNDGNGGSESSPFRSLDKALSYLRSQSDIALEGKYEIHMSGTFTKGYKIQNLPKFRFPIKIIGEVDALGKPITILDGQNANEVSGMWFEPLLDLNVEVHNIHYKNFSAYGLIAKGGGKILGYNCIAENCNIGFAAIRNVDFTFRKCTAINCSASGFRAQYSSSGTFGNETLGISEKCEAIDCPQGIYISRNAVAHVDYCVLNGSVYAGVLVDQNSRVHVLGSEFKNNKYGVRVEGSGEWINNTSFPNEFANNEVNYGHFGNGRESRLYATSSQNEYRVGVNLDRKVVKGTTRTLVHVGSVLGTIPPDFFLTPNQRARIVVNGTTEGTSSGSVLHELISTDNEGGNSTTLQTISENNKGAFQIEYILYPYNDGVHVVTRVSVNGSSYPRVYNRDVSMDLTKERWFRTYATIDNTDFTTTFTSFEMFLMG